MQPVAIPPFFSKPLPSVIARSEATWQSPLFPTSTPICHLQRLDYGNGDRVQYTYDNKGRVTGQTYEDGDTVTYSYDNNGTLAKVKDSATGITTTYHYDLSDRLAKYTESGSGYSHSVSYTYDKLNNLTDLKETVNGTTHLTTYTYDDDNRVICKITGLLAVYYSYDTLGRVTQQVTKRGSATVKTETYTYYGNSTQVASHAVTANGTTSTTTYTYDGNGNILSISDGTNTTSYAYDTANQLVRENNQAAGYTRVWAYNNAGNIEVHRTFDYTTGEVDSSDYTAIVDYQYTNTNWNDLLTGYNGSAFSYDAIGNLTSDGTWAYTWEHGRELTQMSKSGATWDYTYDADGMRTKRTNGTDTYTYVYNGGSLTQMTKGSDTLYFTYDAEGKPSTVTYDGVTYYYVTNLQGDVTNILLSTGQKVVTYTYDAWGRQLSCTGFMANDLGKLNPLRYRGYVYDQETSLYYLQSRYYNPEIGRFINADSQLNTSLGILGLNQFSYCLNNPVNMVDYGGNKPGDLFDTMDEAAKDFAMIYAQLGYENRVEYASFIYSKKVTETRYRIVPTGRFFINFSWRRGFFLDFKFTGFKTVSYKVRVTKYSYVEPNKGSESGVSLPSNRFGTKKKVAEIHNHTWIPGHYNDWFSPGDLNEWINYVSTPSGTLGKYDPNNVSSERDGAIAIFWDTPVDPNWGK